MRQGRGSYGGNRSSALWGKPSKGETRASALWGGKGGRALLSTLVVAVTLSAPVAAGAAASPGPHYAFTTPGLLASAKASPTATFNVIIQGDRDQSTAAIASVVKSELSKSPGKANGIKRRFALINGLAANLTGAQVVKLAQKNGIYAITTDAQVQLAGGLSNKQRWPFVSGVQKFWSGGSAATPTIAIVDSGIDASRADFGGRVVADVNLSTLSGNSAGDGRGHGTFVAGIAAGSGDGYAGAAPASKIVSIDVMDDQGMAMTRDVIAAADWILANRDKYGIRVANFSLHSSVANSFMYDPLNKAVEKLWFNGVVVVAAAGNYGAEGKPSGIPFAPGNDPFVITVGADDIDGSVSTNDDYAAPWSAYGYTLDGFAKPDIAAPGRYLVGPAPLASTLMLEKPASIVSPGYIQLSGTSFAAPVVAGGAAHILAAHPTWTPDQVKGALMLSARWAGGSAPLSTGVGVVDIAKAVALTSAPNPNAALNAFVLADTASGGKAFDAASWAGMAQANASWSSASWASASWASASWSSASWASASWSSASWASASWASDSQSAASWASASWSSASWSDNAELEAPLAEGEYLDESELAEFAADLGLIAADSGTAPDDPNALLP